ncbi:sensor histidine kinase [Paenibacillus glucanolyticus]|jgi:two-component system sensor histidine kinase DesK|uniref:histidine kinase n=1 Tax=Paenibacillus glucanolyticus TaxID=59843 RepID=A0A163KHT7_9BACL|nr:MULTISPECIES: sensor histidine kinase [Paenibacillus]ANA81179.1 histidine kinase [Paenibacillus glucanolyticus]AVV54704.1 sensor histidine kinase [Paenibacillus glucanolyticus]AWP29348.1 sensor histidine kinase [Paenibacillus sp. Cedars]ETT35954.1 integral membrane sensor signal transduction histidine kinase [Paenibacillus sp. FSL R5-808]KZS47235.1 histidine kinase [Paenibacillus glucanolyticus]
MQKWYQIFHKSTGLSPYVWVVFYILPFYFIFRSTSTYQIVIGILMIVMFFAFYVLSFLSKGWVVYFWTSLQILISITMSVVFSYIYFSLFLAFFIGNIRNKAGFFTLYTVHLITTVITVNYGLLTRNPFFITQLPFVLVSVVGVILLPVTNYNRNKNDQLQGQLEDANKRISELVKLEERQRIARDLHDTLGQKLSLIGLKSDLAGKLMTQDTARAQAEIDDVRQTARTALKEVREMVTRMRGTRLTDEFFRIRQILKAAQIELTFEGTLEPDNLSLMNENVISMCLKEAVNNIVKHSNATTCSIAIESTESDLVARVKDNGTGFVTDTKNRGNGLRGMRERLEFVNGSMEFTSGEGTTLVLRVPTVLRLPDKEAGI